MTSRGALLRIALALALVAAVVWAVLNREAFDTAAIEDWLRYFGFWAPVAFILLWALWTVLFLPGAIIGLAGGALFGPVWFK